MKSHWTRCMSCSSRDGPRDSSRVRQIQTGAALVRSGWTVLITALVAAPLLVLIALEDVRHRRIRNRHLAVLSAVIAGGLGLVATTDGSGVLARAALGAVLASLPLLLAALAQPSRMGGGDIKLAVVVGALLGGIHPLLGVAAIGSALVLTLVVVALRRGVRGPLAPGLVACSLVALVAGVALT